MYIMIIRNFQLMVFKQKQINIGEEYQKYDELKTKYNKNLIKNRKPVRLTDGHISKDLFSSLEKEVFESVGYFLLFHQKALPIKYILNPIKLYDAEYDSSEGSITFLYYFSVDFRFFLDPRCRKYRKDIEVEDNRSCLFQINANVLLNDYFVIKNKLNFGRPLSPSRIQFSFTDLDTINSQHPLTPNENISFIYSHDFIVRDLY